MENNLKKLSEAVAKIKKQKALINMNYNLLLNIDVYDDILKNEDKDLHKLYLKQMRRITKDIDLFEPILKLVNIQTLNELYAINQLQLVKLMFSVNVSLIYLNSSETIPDSNNFEADEDSIITIIKDMLDDKSYNEIRDEFFNTQIESLLYMFQNALILLD